METPSKTIAIFSNGSSAQLRPGFVQAMARSARFQIFMIFSISFFVFTRPYELQVDLERWQAISIIVAMGSMVFAIYFVAFSLLIRFGERLRIRRFHTIWLVLATSGLTAFLGQRSLAIFGEPQLSTAYTLLVWGFHFAVFAGLEVLFGIFVLPELVDTSERLPDRPPMSLPSFAEQTGMLLPMPPEEVIGVEPAPLPSASTPAPSPAASAEIPVISISDRRLPARAIRRAASQEHYISISMFGGETHFIRGRIRDFLGQVPEDLGYCIHRSHWVSWKGIERVDNLKDSTTVILDDDTELPVARGRRSDFIARWNRRVHEAAGRHGRRVGPVPPAGRGTALRRLEHAGAEENCMAGVGQG